MTTLRVGKGSLTRLHLATDLLPRGLFRALAGNTPPAPDPDAKVDIPVNAFVYQSGGRCVLIDTGLAAPAPGIAPLLQQLAGMGIAADAVDTVFCTHLHPDHIGGLLHDGRAFFANATLMLHADEGAFWSNPAQRAGAPAAFPTVIEGACAVIAAYAGRIETCGDGTQIAPGARVLHLPGHTPGHSGVQFGAAETGLLMFADIVHCAALQLAAPDTSILFDAYAALAAQTRMRLLTRLAQGTGLVAGSHLDGIGHITQDGQGFAVSPLP